MNNDTISCLQIFGAGVAGGVLLSFCALIGWLTWLDAINWPALFVFVAEWFGLMVWGMGILVMFLGSLGIGLFFAAKAIED